MLPKKRPVDGGAVGNGNINISSSDSESFLRSNKIGCLISPILTATTANSKKSGTGDSNNSSAVLGNTGGTNSVIEPSIPNMALDNGNQQDIDEDLHSRQLAVYGRETMKRLFASNVLVSGMQGLGVEIVKNLVLAGIKSVTLHDEGNVELWDLSSNFIFTEIDVGKNRALVSVQKLQELNNAVVISTLTTRLTNEQLSDFQSLL